MAQAAEPEEAKQPQRDAYSILKDGAMYKIKNRWGNYNDWLGLKDNGKWLKVGCDENLAVTWKVELHEDFEWNHQIYLFETYHNTGYVGWKEDTKQVRAIYNKQKVQCM